MTRTSTYSLREEADRRLRLARLAEANNITYTEDVKNLSYPGLLFDNKYGVTVTQRLQLDHENDIEVGNYRTSSSNDRYSKDGGYIRIKLKKHMPHILLFGQEFSDFEETRIVGSQKVSLEGDFDHHFRLYVPIDRHWDVRYMLPLILWHYSSTVLRHTMLKLSTTNSSCISLSLLICYTEKSTKKYFKSLQL